MNKICEICKKVPATVHLTDIHNNQKRELHMCEGCAEKKGISMKHSLSVKEILGTLEKNAETAAPETDATCSSCGLAWSDFRSGGRLGCAHDYEVFREQLAPFFEEFHSRGGRHLGKHPRLADPQSSRLRDEVDCKRLLREAVEMERYEEAARLRDRLAELQPETDMKLTDIIHNSGEWLRGSGPQSEIVISSRVRLARNLANHRFAARMSPEERVEVAQVVHDAISTIPSGLQLEWLEMDQLSGLDRHLLMERHLISRELKDGSGARAVAVDSGETISVMVIEEDHLRLQSLRSGLQPEEAFAVLNRLDDELGAALDYAFDEKLGFLTACPTNVGTGMRISVMLHLPALVLTRHIEKAFRAIHDLRLTVRGLYGEGTEAHGEFYQISNQITSGRSEQEIIEDLRAVVEGVVAYEKKAREKLLQAEPSRLHDRVWRAYATLRHARIMTSEEAMRLLSAVRLGTHLGILPGLNVQMLNTVFIFSQPAHLQRLEGRELPSEERDIIRARYIRERLAAAEGVGKD